MILRLISTLIGLVFFIASCVLWYSQEPPSPVQKPPAMTEPNRKIQNFSQAKKILKSGQIPNPLTFYCGCSWSQSSVSHGSCGYKPHSRHNERAFRIEWEHIVPAENFGRSFKAWREGDPQCQDTKGRSYRGRRCAQKVSQEFRLMEADLYNLVPSVGEVNQLRGHKGMGLVSQSLYDFGACGVKIDNQRIEPPDRVKGFAARTYFYMDQTYPSHGIVGQKNRKLFEAWHRMYPPTDDEKKRAQAIQRVQGNPQPFVLP
jgi:deoxyribonuclease-1